MSGMVTPILRLELEGMRYQVVHALSIHQEEIQAAVDAAVKAAIESLDFATIVRAEVDRALKDAVKGAIAHGASKVLWDPEIAKIIDQFAKRKVDEAIRNALEKDE